jgi:hypothetical protein
MVDEASLNDEGLDQNPGAHGTGVVVVPTLDEPLMVGVKPAHREGT